MIVFVVDAAAGMTPADLEAAELLRRARAPVIVAVNKADNEKRELEAAEFHALGWEETYAISASHGVAPPTCSTRSSGRCRPESEQELAAQGARGEAEAWADEVAAVPEPFVVGEPEEDLDGEDEGRPAALDAAEAARWDAAIAAEAERRRRRSPSSGRPNVGKSSLLNALLGEERAIVSRVPGTTRDAIDTRLAWGRSEVVLIDTAGIRRRGKVASGPAAERYSTLRALTALSRADVAVLVIDAVEGLTSQDAHVAGYAVEEGKGLVVAVNKWDLGRGQDRPDVRPVRRVDPQRRAVPRLRADRVDQRQDRPAGRRVLELAVDIWAERRRRIPTGELNRLLMAATDRTPPPLVRGKRPKLFYATQAAIAPPTFVFFASDASAVHFSYRRYLENRLRETFGFDGTPIRLVFRDRASVKLPRRRRKPARVAAASHGAQAARDGRRRGARRPLMDDPPARRGRRRRGVGHDARAILARGASR